MTQTMNRTQTEERALALLRKKADPYLKRFALVIHTVRISEGTAQIRIQGPKAEYYAVDPGMKGFLEIILRAEIPEIQAVQLKS